MDPAAGIAAFIQGLVLGASICLTLGPQSAFVLQQGLHRQSATTVAMVCTLCDLTLIIAGAAGFGLLVNAVPNLTEMAAWGSALFALAYGWQVLRSMRRQRRLEHAGHPSTNCLLPMRAVAGALTLSLLNPQTYLEMVAVVGAIAIQFPMPNRIPFVVGVMLISPLWFYGLAYGGRRLAPLLARSNLTRKLDGCIAIMMLGLGVSILWAHVGVQ